MLAALVRTSIPTGLVMLAASSATSIASAQTHVLQQVALDVDARRTVAAVGDLNGDGLPDVLAGESLLGRVRVYSGASGGVLLELTAPMASSDFGAAVAGLGDVDGDGTPDFVVGAPREGPAAQPNGAAYVYSGATGALLRSFQGQAFDRLGSAVANAGDVDGDGMNDVLIGAPYAPFGGSSAAGTATVYSMATGAILAQAGGDSHSDHAGSAVAPAGDVDIDGVLDFAFGAPDDLASTVGGSVSIHSGATGIRIHRVYGPSDDAEFGSALDGGLDVDGDGVPDVVAGAPDYRAATGSLGRVSVISGSTGLVVSTFDGEDSDDELGADLTLVPDVDGDGRAEILAGAIGAEPSTSHGANDYGEVWLLPGAGGAPLLRLAGDRFNHRYGQSVAAIGDLDGDGISELCATIGLGHAYKILSIQPVPHPAYCSALANSTGGPAALQATGFGSVIGNDLVLHMTDVPAAATTIFFFGVSEGFAPLGDGVLCAGGPFVRLSGALTASTAGTVDHAVDLSSLWLGGHLSIGTTIYCQGWFRDVTPGGSNLSNGLRVHTVY